MKKILTLFIAIFLLNTSLYAKRHKHHKRVKVNQNIVLYKTLKRYIKAQKKGDVKKIIKYTYPGLFKVTPKKSLAKELKTYYSSHFKYTKSYNIKKIMPIKRFSKGYYTRVFYTAYAYKSAKDKKAQKLYEDILKNRMGKDAKITFDKKRALISSKKDLTLIAIKRGKGGWRFIDKDRALSSENILPKEVYKALSKSENLR